MKPVTSNLSGFWTGTYWYDEPGEPSVSFLALINDDNGALDGEVSEPNTFGYTSNELRAFIVGQRDGKGVTFAKVYDGESDAAHRVDYKGIVSDDNLRLSGYWLLEEWSGKFEMNRTIVPQEEAQGATAEAPLAISRVPAFGEKL